MVTPGPIVTMRPCSPASGSALPRLVEHEEARGGADVSVLREHGKLVVDLLGAQPQAALDALDDPAAAGVDDPVVDGGGGSPRSGRNPPTSGSGPSPR